MISASDICRSPVDRSGARLNRRSMLLLSTVSVTALLTIGYVTWRTGRGTWVLKDGDL